MADLNEEQKLELVSMLACFREPATIIAHFLDDHGLSLTHKQVGMYDPTRSYYSAGEKWRDIFDAKRAAYMQEVASIPIANQGFRLNLLNEQAMKAFKENKPALGAQLLEQAAKEVGGILTNERNVRVDDSRRQRASEMSSEDRRAALVQIIAEAMQSRDPPGTDQGTATAQ